MVGAQEIFEAYLADEPNPAGGVETLCSRHPEHAAALRELWDDYHRVAGLLSAVCDDAREPSDAAPSVRYEVRGEIARGGMGRVLEVWDGELRRTLAMKVLRDEPARDGARRVHWDRQRSRLLNEAQILGQLEHPGIVPIHEVGRDAQGRPYFTMLRVRGRSLGEILEDVQAGRDGWTLTRAVGVLQRVCEAVAHAHSKGVIHRDLKPSNVMVGPFGEVFVMDWGLAKARGRAGAADIRLRTSTFETSAGGEGALAAGQSQSVHTDRRDASDEGEVSPLMTMDGDVLGTPAYMAPEQAAGRVEQVDERADVYSTGAMLYHLLSGRAPYLARGGSSTPQEVLLAVQGGEPEALERFAPEAPPELAAICARSMARERDVRYTTMADMADDLRAHLEGRVVLAHRTGTVVELRKWVQRNRGAAVALATGVLAIIGVAVVQTVLKGQVESARSMAEARAEAVVYSDYINKISLAQAALEKRDVAGARTLLAECPDEHRGWEWRYLEGQRDTSSWTLETDWLLECGAPFSPDGRTLAVPSLDDPRGLGFQLWDVETREPVRRLVGYERKTYGGYPAFSPDGENLVAGSDSGFAYLWSLGDADDAVRRFGPHEGEVRGTAFSPDGTLLALSTRGGVGIWELGSGELRSFLAGPQVMFWGVGWSAAGDVVVASNDAGGLMAWRPATGEVVYELDVSSARADGLSVSPDGSQVAVGYWDRRVRVHDLETGAVVREFPDFTDGGVHNVAWDPGGLRVAAACNSVRMLDVDSGTELPPLLGQEHGVQSVSFSPDGRWLAAVDLRGVVKLWDLERRGRVSTQRVGGSFVRGLAISPDGKRLACSLEDGELSVWDLGQRRRLRRLPGLGGRGNLEWSSDGKWLALAGYGSPVHIIDATSWEPFRTLDVGANNATFHPDGRRVFSGGSDGYVRAWDLRTGLELWAVTSSAEAVHWIAGVHALASPDGELVGAGDQDGRIRLWSASDGALVRELEGHSVFYTNLSFSPDGRLLTASGVGSDSIARIEVWRVEDGSLAWLKEGDKYVRPLFSHDGRRIFARSSSGDEMLDAATGRALLTLESERPGIARHVVSPAGDLIVGGTMDGWLQFWTAPLGTRAR